jgi:hypothetical protein
MHHSSSCARVRRSGPIGPAEVGRSSKATLSMEGRGSNLALAILVPHECRRYSRVSRLSAETAFLFPFLENVGDHQPNDDPVGISGTSTVIQGLCDPL